MLDVGLNRGWHSASARVPINVNDWDQGSKRPNVQSIYFAVPVVSSFERRAENPGIADSMRLRDMSAIEGFASCKTGAAPGIG